MPRVPYVPSSALEDSPTLEFGAETADDRMESSLLLGHNQSLLAVYRRFGNDVRAAVGLNRRQQELLLLGVARELECPYMYHVHVERGLAAQAGVSDEVVEAIYRGDWDKLNSRDGALVTFAAAVAANAVEDDQFEALATFLDDEGIVDVTVLTGYFVLAASVYNALDLDPGGITKMDGGVS